MAFFNDLPGVRPSRGRPRSQFGLNPERFNPGHPHFTRLCGAGFTGQIGALLESAGYTSRNRLQLEPLGQASLATMMTKQAVQGIYFWLGMIVVGAIMVVIIGLVVRRIVRRRFVNDTGPGFLLSDLRQLHREVKLSDSEFEAARATMIAKERAIETSQSNPTDSAAPESGPGPSKPDSDNRSDPDF